MALQVPSGLIVSASGAGGAVIASPIPIVIVGAAGGLSGLHTITDMSGALNVNISGGSITTSISGNIVLVTSGGTVQVSGNVNVVSGGGPITVQTSGTNANVVIAASGGATLFRVQSLGGLLVEGSQGGGTTDPISAGNYNELIVYNFNLVSNNASGSVGSWASMRSAPNSSGAASGAGILGAGLVALNPGGTNFNIVQLAQSGQGALQVGMSGGGPVSVTGSSGGSFGVLAVQPVGYSYVNAAGAAITNVKSGAGFLHAVNINQTGGSGQQLKIYDSASGVGGATIGTILGTASGAIAGGSNIVPTYLLYDLLFTSGLVLSTSGAAWDITVTWRTATS